MGICIMTGKAIAMVDDSAVRIGEHTAIHNSANKIFALPRVAPVGGIVYAKGSQMYTVVTELKSKVSLTDHIERSFNE